MPPRLRIEVSRHSPDQRDGLEPSVLIEHALSGDHRMALRSSQAARTGCT